MLESLQNIRNQTNEYFQKLDKKQKIRLGAGAGISLAVLTLLILFFLRTDYVPLYSNLEARQSGEIMETLRANNIDAKYGRTSSEILVDEEDLHDAEVIIATQGLPKTTSAYDELFGSSFMMTSEDRKKQYQISLQNHLAQTISRLEGIRGADVNISLPERTGYVFADREEHAKATVSLHSLDRSLEQQSVDGIAVLVSNAVEGLEPESVSIHGPDGRVLNTTNQGEEHYSMGDQRELQLIVQQDLEDSIREFLGTVYGPENLSIITSVQLNFDSRVREEVRFEPPIEGETEGIPRSLQEFEKSSYDEVVGGVPGTDENIEAPQYVEGEEGTARYEEASRTINYEINEINERIVGAQGQVEDISVAVYVNSGALADGDLSEEERLELESLISAAAGLQTEVVEVAVRDFVGVEGVEVTPPEDMPWWQNPTILIGLIGILILAIIIGIFAIRKRRREEREIEENLAQQEPALQKESSMSDIDLDMQGSEVKQQIEKLVDKKPDAVAQLLRNWISEE